MAERFPHRQAAGEALADQLAEQYGGRQDVVVLGLPRGGVPVAAPVAERLAAALDILVVRKLGTPGQPELAMGAIASGGARMTNSDVIRRAGVTDQALEEVAAREAEELARRETEYRGDKPFPDLRGKTVILVDDGLATGASMQAAVDAVRQHQPASIAIAVPVAPPEARRLLSDKVDDYVVLREPEAFMAVGNWYEIFDQTSDEEVRHLLQTSISTGT